jgi:hypothetical protein
MVIKMRAENEKWMAAQRKIVNRSKEEEKKQFDAAKQRSEIRARLTPQQRAVDDDFATVLDLYLDRSDAPEMGRRREQAARELKELREYGIYDVQISESPTPSVIQDESFVDYETEPLIGSSIDLVERTFGASARSKGGICGSSAIPMGVYKPGRHPMTARRDFEYKVDEQGGCWSPAIWCWDWGIWRYLSCGWNWDGSQHGPVESLGS